MTILKFYADWCAPCKRLDPIFEEIENEYDVGVKHVNIDDKSNMTLMTEHTIRSVPTVVFLDGEGETIDTIIGSHPKSKYTTIIENK